MNMRSSSHNAFIAIACVCLLAITGCGAAEETGSTQPERSFERTVNLGAVGFAIDDFRAAADAHVESIKSCADIVRITRDATAFELCIRRAQQSLPRSASVVIGTLEAADAEAPPACSRRLRAIGNRLVNATARTIKTGTKVATADQFGEASAALDAMDSAFARLDAAYASARAACGA